MKLLDRLVAAIIAHAVRSPYFHLPGYMERFWVVRPRWWTLGFAVRVHHILRSDTDRDLHDHPWAFISLMLRGGYYEERPLLKDPPTWVAREPTTTRWHRPGSLLFRWATSRHRLMIPRRGTAWTLVITFPKTHEWGFYTASRGKVIWKEYLPADEVGYQREQLDAQRGAA